jgi:AraC family transcriptional regulator
MADLIAIHIGHHYESADGAASAGLSPARLTKVRSYIEAHLDEAIVVADLAAAVHMRPFHFARMFKKATGEAPHLHVTGRRVQKARELLLTGDRPLAEIAARVGFRTQGHFTSVFRRYTGLPPRAFRAKYRAI